MKIWGILGRLFCIVATIRRWQGREGGIGAGGEQDSNRDRKNWVWPRYIFICPTKCHSICGARFVILIFALINRSRTVAIYARFYVWRNVQAWRVRILVTVGSYSRDDPRWCNLHLRKAISEESFALCSSPLDFYEFHRVFLTIGRWGICEWEG